MNGEVTIGIVKDTLRRLGGWNGIFIPEFTWGGLRIDALVVETGKRWIRGFEIKMSREDYKRDDKWHLYSEFCSSLSIACPAGLIRKEEVGDPFGLLWVKDENFMEWVKKPKRFQRRDSLSWMWTYMKVIEAELPRLENENQRLKGEIEWMKQMNEAKTTSGFPK